MTIEVTFTETRADTTDPFFWTSTNQEIQDALDVSRTISDGLGIPPDTVDTSLDDLSSSHTWEFTGQAQLDAFRQDVQIQNPNVYILREQHFIDTGHTLVKITKENGNVVDTVQIF